jgi:hypothetical protein
MEARGARREVAARIEALGGGRRRLPPADQMRELRAIRSLAHGAGLRAVASLAHALERELLACGDEAPFHAYLERMSDAVHLEADSQPGFVELALATVGARLALA